MILGELTTPELSVVPIYRVSRLVRVQVFLSGQDDAAVNMLESKSKILSNFDRLKTMITKWTNASAYLLFAVSCGSETQFARTLTLDSQLLTVVSSLNFGIAISLFPLNDD